MVVTTVGSYTVNGTVSGLLGPLVLQNNGTDDLTVLADGPFSFPTRIADGGDYSVTVSANPPSQTCTVTNGTGTINGDHVTDVVVECESVPDGSYTVGGVVSGLVGTGLVLQNNGGDDLLINTAGPFTFPTPLPDGAIYEVTVLTQPSGSPQQTCTVVSGGIGTVNGADVTSVMLTCTTDTFTVGGTVSGLTSGTVVLQNNGGDDLSISANGPFTFMTPIADLSSYQATILSYPIGDTCAIANASGTINGANVTDLQVDCAGNPLETIRASVASSGSEGRDSSERPAIGDDGNYVAFRSAAANLVPGDLNIDFDVFVHHAPSGQTTRASVPNEADQVDLGLEGDGDSYAPSISAGAAYVAFGSIASNLVMHDTNGVRDVFVHQSGPRTTIRVSVASDGTQGDGTSRNPSISADGRYVAFSSFASNLVGGDTNGVRDVFVHDTQTGVTTRVSVPDPPTVLMNGIEGNQDSFVPSISADGRIVAFDSDASNLVADDTNGVRDIFVHDTQSGRTMRVSVPDLASQFGLGTEGLDDSFNPSISGNGLYVAFGSNASNMVLGDTNGVRDSFLY